MIDEKIIYTGLLIATLLLVNFATYFKNPQFIVSFDQRDFVFFSGIVLVGIGAYMIYQPAAFIVTGLMLFWTARPR
jgi:hypothetical protein